MVAKMVAQSGLASSFIEMSLESNNVPIHQRRMGRRGAG